MPFSTSRPNEWPLIRFSEASNPSPDLAPRCAGWFGHIRADAFRGNPLLKSTFQSGPLASFLGLARSRARPRWASRIRNFSFFFGSVRSVRCPFFSENKPSFGRYGQTGIAPELRFCMRSSIVKPEILYLGRADQRSTLILAILDVLGPDGWVWLVRFFFWDQFYF